MQKADLWFLQQTLVKVFDGEPTQDFRSNDFARVLALVDEASSTDTPAEGREEVLRSMGNLCLLLILDRHIQSMVAQREAAMALDEARKPC
ncbi:MAG: hypothetical protein KF891_04005 [Rhizobacter sp.]|nr:hypothetical protein [Rhizobacter sp.]